jgi:hypothetical protein
MEPMLETSLQVPTRRCQAHSAIIPLNASHQKKAASSSLFSPELCLSSLFAERRAVKLQKLVTVHGFQSAVVHIVPERSSYGKLKT